MNAKRVLLLAVLGAYASALAMMAQGLPTAPAPALKAPSTFGTSNTVYVSVGDWKFTPATSSWTYGDTAGNQPMRYGTVSGMWLLAAPELPSGALLQYIELDYCNTNATQPLTLNMYQTTFNNVVEYTLANVIAPANSGCSSQSFDMSIYGITVDNYQKRYPLYAFFGTNADSTTALAGAIIGYKLQVSPAPGVATFPDVPTSDFGFQYVEALVAAGITGGCGGGNYCPDNFVTRRQMAIFISKALGLSYR